MKKFQKPHSREDAFLLRTLFWCLLLAKTLPKVTGGEKTLL